MSANSLPPRETPRGCQLTVICQHFPGTRGAVSLTLGGGSGCHVTAPMMCVTRSSGHKSLHIQSSSLICLLSGENTQDLGKVGATRRRGLGPCMTTWSKAPHTELGSK